MDSNMRRSIILDNYQNVRNMGTPTTDDYIKINSNNVSCSISYYLFNKTTGK